MKNLFLLLFISTMLSCIDNDIPYPVIQGEVVKIEVEGQEKVVIDTKQRIVSITLGENVDISNVKILNLEVTKDSLKETISTLKTGDILDLSKPVQMDISLYQKYSWTIEATQDIERYVSVEDQVGESLVNEKDRTVTFYVKDDVNLDNINISSIKLAASGAEYSPSISSLHDFLGLGQRINVTLYGKTETWTIFGFHQSEMPGALSDKVEAWATFATFYGSIPSSSTQIPSFEYKKQSDSKWISVDADVFVNKFSKKVTGLSPNTTYVFRGVVGSEVGETITFTTEKVEQIPYMNFDKWYIVNKCPYVGEEGLSYWDSGNAGGASFNVIPTTEEKSDVVSGSAGRLASRWAVVKFAAGNIYTGKFVKLDGLDAVLDFGIPYTCRPTKLTGYYKYNSSNIDRTKAPYTNLSGVKDSCHIYVALANWTAPFRVESKTNTFLDCSPDNKSIIAYGELVSAKDMSSYEKFTINLNYRDVDTKPTYIVIVASASKYGDYFTGSTESVLLVDEWKLEFD